MDYMILDSAGNAVASFDNDATARATMHAIVAIEPEAADHLVLLAYDDEGMPVGEARTFVDVAPAFVIEPSQFVQTLITETLVREVRRKRTFHYGNPVAWGSQPSTAILRAS
jgi:hypothetical protein